MKHIELLKKYSLKATPQRICILKVLDKHEHPTIDELFSELKEFYPTISLATVYKNLNSMIEAGMVIDIKIAGQKSRYDIFEYPHIHMICQDCGKVFDIDINGEKLKEYKQNLSKFMNQNIEKLNILASVKGCEFCEC